MAVKNSENEINCEAFEAVYVLLVCTQYTC